jgi:hypothetical protein
MECDQAYLNRQKAYRMPLVLRQDVEIRVDGERQLSPTGGLAAKNPALPPDTRGHPELQRPHNGREFGHNDCVRSRY